MKIVEYAKEHPWATGIIVIIGGIIFLSITGVFGGGGESDGSGGAPSRPSDAEVMANAQIAAATIQANAATSAAQIGAGTQMNSDNLAAQVAIRTIEAQEKLGLFQTEAERDVAIKTIEGQTTAVTATIAGQQAQYQSIINSLGSIKKKNRDDVLQALITGQPYYAQQNPGNSAAGIITSIGNLAGNVSKLIPMF